MLSEGGRKLSSIWKINLKEGRYNCANYATAADTTLVEDQHQHCHYTIQ